jgi:hypothetical protein
LAQIARLQLYEECFLWGESRFSHAANVSFSIRTSGFETRCEMDIVRTRKSPAVRFKNDQNRRFFSAAVFPKLQKRLKQDGMCTM